MSVLRKQFLAPLVFALGIGSSAANAEPVGIFALLEDNPPNLSLSAAAQGCSVAHQGGVLARQGNLDLPEVAGFALLSCDDRLLDDPKRVEAAFGGQSPLVTLEGGLTSFDIPSGVPDPQNREYIIKLSYYNNADLVGRTADLEELQQLVRPLPDPYRNEKFLEVHRASGMRTPDEVVVIYYESPAAGDRFRESNQAVLEKVGAFNKKHLVSFVYLIANAD